MTHKDKESVRARIARAKELLTSARHAAMATVNADGTPHNTPFFLMLDDRLEHLYFGSHPESLHSQNVVRSGEIFVVLYEPNQGGGLYVKAVNGHELKDKELEVGLAVHNAKRTLVGKEALPLSYYSESPQRMYGADIATLWINLATRDKAGHILREYRHEITAQDLLE